MNTLISLGQRIRELRLKHRLTQIELAVGICTPSMVSQIESDRARPSYKILSALAEKLEVPLEKLLENVELNAEIMSSYKMAQSMMAAKEYLAAIPLLQELMQVSRAYLSQDELRIELAECYLHTGQYSKADQLIQQVQETAVFRRDGRMIIRTYRNIGLIEYHMKRYHLAIHHWQKALEEMSRWEMQDDTVKAQLLTDIGQAHEQLGMVKDAIQFYTEATTLYGNTEQLDEIARVYMNLARTSKRLFDYETSLEYSHRAITLFETLENRVMKLKVQIYSAASIAKEGREQEAIPLLEEAILKLQELRNHEDLGIAYVELANIQSSLGELDKAEESCQIARGLLPELHKYQAVCNRIIGNIEQQRGNDDESTRRYKMAADCFQQIGEIGEWATTMVEMARLNEQRRDFQEAYRITSEVQKQTQQVLYDRGIVL